MISVFLNLLRLVLWLSTKQKQVIYPTECSMSSWKECILLFWNGMFYIYLLSSSCLISYLNQCFCTHFIFRWSLHWYMQVLIFLTITVLLLNYHFISVNICFMHLDALMLDSHAFTVVISSYWIDPFSLGNAFLCFLLQSSILKSILSDIITLS